MTNVHSSKFSRVVDNGHRSSDIGPSAQRTPNSLILNAVLGFFVRYLQRFSAVRSANPIPVFHEGFFLHHEFASRLHREPLS